MKKAGLVLLQILLAGVLGFLWMFIARAFNLPDILGSLGVVLIPILVISYFSDYKV